MISRHTQVLRSRLPAATTWLAWLLPVFAWAPLTYPGYFEFHSGFAPIFNLNDLWRNLADLGWAPVIGQPYDLWRGERVLPYVLAALPRAVGVESVTAIKCVFGLSILAGALGMYGWSRRRLGDWPGLLAAAVYAFWPIGLATVYVRGAIAEAAFLGLMPFLLWAVDAKADVGPAIAIGLLLAAAFWTQAGLAAWLAAIVLGYMLSLGPHKLRIDEVAPDSAPEARRRFPSHLHGLLPAAYLGGWVGGLLLAALGLLPLVLRRGMGGGDGWVVFAEHFAHPHQLLLAGWGRGPSVPGPYDTLPLQLGVVAFGLVVLSVVVRGQEAGGRREGGGDGREVQIRHTTCLALAIVLLVVFLSTTLAAPVWRELPFLARTLTYPWQLLLLVGPWLAWLAGLGGKKLEGLLPEKARETASVPLFSALIALALLGSYTASADSSMGPLVPPATRAPIPDAPMAIFGDNEIMLLSAVTAGVPGPGGRMTVLVRWQALRPLERDYTVFLHAVGPNGQRWGQIDTMPQGGQSPTSQWRPGQVITDRYELTLKPDAPITRDYRFLLGLYQWQTGERLSTGVDDKVVLR